jgi:hypothetical protein
MKNDKRLSVLMRRIWKEVVTEYFITQLWYFLGGTEKTMKHWSDEDSQTYQLAGPFKCCSMAN